MRVQIDHVGIAVRDLEQSIAIFGAIFGLQASGREFIPTQRVRVAMLSANNLDQASKLELLEAADDQSVLGKFISRSGAGLHHLALQVDNLEEAVARVRTHGLEIIGEPQRGAGDCRFVFVHPRSAGGVLTELLQRHS